MTFNFRLSAAIEASLVKLLDTLSDRRKRARFIQFNTVIRIFPMSFTRVDDHADETFKINMTGADAEGEPIGPAEMDTLYDAVSGLTSSDDAVASIVSRDATANTFVLHYGAPGAVSLSGELADRARGRPVPGVVVADSCVVTHGDAVVITATFDPVA